jgi:hypothetical protein
MNPAPFDPISTPVPSHLGGFQLVENGTAELGDLIVYDNGTRKDMEWAGVDTISLDCCTLRTIDLRLYRKMPTPSAAAMAGLERPQPLAPGSFTLPPDEAKTDDGNKPPLSMLPWKALDEVAMVQLYGERKYGDFHNYRKGMRVSRSVSCIMRHLRAYMNGEDLDSESGRLHAAHAAARCLFLLQNIAEGTAIDDRYKPTL